MGASSCRVWHLAGGGGGGQPNVSTWLECRDPQRQGELWREGDIVTSLGGRTVLSRGGIPEGVKQRGHICILEIGLWGARAWPGGGELGQMDLLADKNPEA